MHGLAVMQIISNFTTIENIDKVEIFLVQREVAF